MSCDLVLVLPGGLKAVITDRRNRVLQCDRNKTAPQVCLVLASSHICFYQNVPEKYIKRPFPPIMMVIWTYLGVCNMSVTGSVIVKTVL